MKTKLTIFLVALTFTTGRSLLAGDSPEKSRASTLLPAGEEKCACCAVEAPKPAAAPCCTELTPAAPLSARSIYQLDARFTDDDGRPVALASLRGRPVIVAMFFASCEYACPVIVDDIRRLRAELPAAVRAQARVMLVSFDVARDTPPALKAFRARMNLDDAWTLARGEAPAVQELAMLLGVKFKQDARGQFSHSNLITVLNPEGEIVHQRAGLMGDVSEAAKAVALAAPGGAR
ncbi:MAG: SCO family protein [Verrucomicrobia bacterium]|nr:SCO family protein [Verrucomicrobiota bacterium]